MAYTHPANMRLVFQPWQTILKSAKANECCRFFFLHFGKTCDAVRTIVSLAMRAAVVIGLPLLSFEKQTKSSASWN